MGTAERRAREKERRRRAIVEAAERVFFTRGFQTATMDDVAGEAELSKGTLYLYFKHKEDLHHAVSLRGIEILRDLFQEVLERNGNGREKLMGIGEAYFRYAREYPDHFRHMVQSVTQMSEEEMESPSARECHDAGNVLIKQVSEALRCGMDDGTLRSDRPLMETALVLWGQATGVVQLISMQKVHMEQGFGMDPQRLVALFFEMVACSLSPGSVGRD